VSDIDHVAIGPGGVFTINTKNHSGKRVTVGAKGVWVNGTWTPHARNSAYEADRATRLLSEACEFPVFVGGVVVALCGNFSRKAHPSPVHVLARSELQRWLRNRKAVLSPDSVEDIYQRARWASTWSGT
jgi:hypothetical protein